MLHICVWGYPSEVRVYNRQKKKLNLSTINGYFVGYAERSKGYKFYYPSHSTRIIESRNAKFIKNNLISGSDQYQSIVSKKDQSFTSSERLVIIHNTHQVQIGVEQSIIEIPQAVDNNPVDQVVKEMLEIVEQLVG